MQLWVYFLVKLLDNYRIFALDFLCFHIIDCLLDTVLILLCVVNYGLFFDFPLILLLQMPSRTISKNHTVSVDLVKLVSIHKLFKFLLLPVLFHLLFFFLYQLFFPLFHKAFFYIFLISYNFLFFDIVIFPRVLHILIE